MSGSSGEQLATGDGRERRWFGLPARFVLLCLGCALFGAAIGLFATGSWAWATVMLLLGIILVTLLGQSSRRDADAWMQGSSNVVSDGRSHAVTAVEVWRTRLDMSLTRWRTRSRLDTISHERGPALRALGEAVWAGDEAAEKWARLRLGELELERRRIEEELAEHLARADARIDEARLPVQQTLVVAPNEPSAPYPPPDEGNPPQPAEVPEAYPPPDEGTPPAPAPDPGQTERG